MFFNLDGLGEIIFALIAVGLTLIATALKLFGLLIVPWWAIIGIVPAFVLLYVLCAGIGAIFKS
jgi:hypothetical protein